MEKTFRNYDQSDITAAVREHYRKMRQNQTLDYVHRMHKKYLNFDKPMPLWEAMEHLNNLIDVSDPDLDLPNVQHLIQSAEAIRKDGRPDWMQLTGLIHDLGKVMFLWGSDEDGTSQAEQWGMVGDVLWWAAPYRIPVYIPNSIFLTRIWPKRHIIQRLAFMRKHVAWII